MFEKFPGRKLNKKKKFCGEKSPGFPPLIVCPATKSQPFRKLEHKKERLSFAEEHQNWLNEWDNIIWSNEIHFEVFCCKNRTFVRRLKSECNQLLNFLPRMQVSEGHVSVWSYMSGGPRDPLVIYSFKVNEPAYIKIIEEALPTFIENTFDSELPTCFDGLSAW